MQHQPPAFFNRGPAPFVRLTFFALLSIFLMILDARFRYAEPLRQVIALAAYPVQQVAMAPVEAFGRISEFFTSQAALRGENSSLRADMLQNAQGLLTLEAVQAENRRLRQLLEAREQLPAGAVFAEIVYAGRDPFSRKVMIDKGSQHGIGAGLPVIDASGVLGQVTRVHPLLAEVTLITEKDHAIPVQVVRNGLRGVAYGSGDGSTLDLRHLATNAEVENGDLLVTSGLDGVYPRGLPVAKIVKIEREAGFAFARISCAPMAGTSQYRQVLVIGRTEELPEPPAADDAAAKKGARAKRPGRRGE